MNIKIPVIIQLAAIVLTLIAIGVSVGYVVAHADSNCQPAYGGVEDICTTESGRQVVCFNWGQQAGKCVDMSNGHEVVHP